MMYLKICLCFLLIYSCAPAFAGTQPAIESFSAKNNMGLLFHAPSTEAEKTLDAILTRAGSDENLFEFILRRPWYDPAKDDHYNAMFTPALLRAWAEAEAIQLRENCGGTYQKGEICGIDYDPITCSQDPPDAYMYRTKILTKQKAVISSMAPYLTKEIASYTLVRHENKWQLDGVDCGEGAEFNVHKTNADIDK